MRVYHRNTAIFAGIFSLIQGGIWAWLAIWGVGIHACTFEYNYYTNEPSAANLFYFSYLLGKCRYIPSQTAPTLAGPSRTYSVLLAYGILSAIWIPSAILVLVASVNKIHGKTGARCYYPWLLSTAALLVLDVVASIIYGIDISHTLTAKDYLQWNPYVRPDLVRDLDGITVIPAVIMVVIFTRAIIIWLINAVVFGVLIQAVIVLNRPSPTADFVENEARMKPQGTNTGSSNWVRAAKRSVGVPDQPFELAEPRRRQPMPTRTVERPNIAEQRTGKTIELDHTIIQSPTEERERPVLKPLPLQSQLNSSPPPPPPKTPPFFNVYGKPTTPDSPQPVFVRSSSSNQIIDQGVNKDMPWSYVSPQKLPPQPKNIPEPDYTLHRAPRRQNINYSNLSTPSEEDEIKSTPPAKRFENKPNVWKVM